MNRERMAEGIRTFLEGLLADRPAAGAPGAGPTDAARIAERVAAAFADDLCGGYAIDPAALLRPMPLDTAAGPVVLRDLRFVSLCAHHLLPYEGVAHVGFVPRGCHVGLGALARVVDALARRLTLQESLTAAIADTLERGLAPRAVVVVLEARHGCLAHRGARQPDHRLTTIERRGETAAELDRLVLGR
ncbi:MAG: GTP cyclohydrolase I FolE [Acidobacteria bacterium]|nr:MAG: GTP cyclohydrolase I FolE [Acidobacteriota bacterium]